MRRVKINMEFEVNLDSVPGWGHKSQDWVDLINSSFIRQSHYATESKVISIDETLPYKRVSP